MRAAPRPAGETYTLTDRGVPVAQITPHRPHRWRTAEEANAILRALGPDPVWLDEVERRRAEVRIEDPWDRT